MQELVDRRGDSDDYFFAPYQGAETTNLANKRKERLEFDWVLNLDTARKASENCLPFQNEKFL